MPELPEVEVVRRGLADHVLDRTINAVEVLHPRPVRRHLAGPDDFARRLLGQRFTAARRRGKYLWLPTSAGDAVVGHLGMSGQMLVQGGDAPDERHLRVRFRFEDDGPELRFVDQRMFGGLSIDEGGADLPGPLAHIARDPLDPEFSAGQVIDRIRRSDSGIKRLLLNQNVISGVGNIYADEGLWRARIHGERPGSRLSRAAIGELIEAVTAVMTSALAQGGTSFDALYVNVNGQSGYFDRSLEVYGQEGQECSRCHTLITRVAFMNRSSYFCPVCQPAPRSTRGGSRTNPRGRSAQSGR